MSTPPFKELSIFTLGHSNQPMESFLALLKQHHIAVVVDTRSSPYSRYASQFNKESMKLAVGDAGIQYVYMGGEVGGRPQSSEYYDDEGHVLYAKVAGSEAFKSGLDRLLTGIRDYRVALLCSEENPTHCHRRLLISRVLFDRNIQIMHIRGGGTVQTEEQLRAEVGDGPAAPRQQTLFGEEEPAVWRSTLSVLPRSQRPSSSES
ncbi:MAG: DUF488 domain-containing protein [Chloroflexia bacterium]|nr:DUF488 domain-containing protein [Chloroflexia bacterium]